MCDICDGTTWHYLSNSVDTECHRRCISEAKIWNPLSQDVMSLDDFAIATFSYNCRALNCCIKITVLSQVQVPLVLVQWIVSDDIALTKLI